VSQTTTNIFCDWTVHHLKGYARLTPPFANGILTCEKQSLTVGVYPLHYAIWLL